ncbi:MAG: DUF6443 domain-containing protein, partial [Cyclobacteriaceae bacterium]
MKNQIQTNLNPTKMFTFDARYSLLFLAFFVSFLAYAQPPDPGGGGGGGGGGTPTLSISGPSTANINENKTYTVSAGGGTHSYSSYSVSGGYITYSNKTTVKVTWTSIGSSRWVKVTAGVGSSTLSKTKYVTVSSGPTAPPNPSNPWVHSTNNCGNKTLRRPNPPTGVTYYWQTSSSGTSTSNYSLDYTLTGSHLSTQTRYVRARNNSSGLWSNGSGWVQTTMFAVPTAGSIGNAQTLCYGGNPSTLTNTASGTGGYGSINYQWQYNTGSGWANVSGATSTTYNPPALYTTTSYRRRAASCAYTIYSNTVTVSIYGNLSAGSIGNAQTVCYEGNPSTLSNTATASGGNGTIAYLWQYRSPGGSWTTATGTVTGSTYNPPALTSTKEYRRRAYSCGQYKYTNTATVTVRPALVSGNIGGTQTVCYGSVPSTLTNTSSPSGGDGGYSYQWRKFVSTWQDIPGATASSYTPPALISSTLFLRNVTSCGQTKSSNAISITVNPDLDAGLIGNAQTVCSDVDPSSLTSLLDASGGNTSSYVYQWQSRSPGGSWSDLTGETSTTYNPPVLASDKEYQRRVISCSQTKYSNTIVVTVNLIPTTPPSPVISSNLCGDKTIPLPSAPGGETYYWQTSVDGESESDIASNKILSTDGTLYIRGKSTAGCWSPARTVNVVVNEIPAAPSAPGVSSNQCGDKTLTLPSAPAGETYFWQTTAAGEVQSDSDPTKLATATTTYYVRSISSAGCWSATTTLPVTVNEIPAVPAMPVITPGTDQTTLTKTTSPPGETWFWQATAAGIETDNSAVDLILYDDVTVYLRSRGAGNCWSTARTIVVNVDHDAFLTSVSSTSVLKEAVSEETIDELPVADKAMSRRYMDGLGRTIQAVAWQASPNQKDVVSAVKYDYRGRVQKSYLPYVSTNNTGGYRENAINGIYTSSEQYLFYQNTTAVIHDTQPYAETVFETSPMSRVLEQSAAGSAWGLSTGKTTKVDFEVYSYDGADKIYKWKVTAGLPETNGTYLTGHLMISESVDADNHQVSTYTDKTGKTILKRIENGTQDRMTYYVYNESNQLSHIIPPKESYEITELSTTVDSAYVNSRLFHYTYDERGRVKTKETPDAGQVQYVYDHLDRVAMTQDANQRALSPTKQWSFVKYDELGRPTASGVYNSNDTQSALQAGAYDTINGDTLSINFYDSYAGTTATYSTAYDSHFSTAPVADDNLHGKNTRSRTKILGGTTWLESVIFYDDYGRAIQVQSGNHRDGTDVATMEYDFAGRLLTAVAFYDNPQAQGMTIVKTMTYDHAGRLLELTHKTDNEPKIILAAYTYNALGQVIDKKLHSEDLGTTYEQSIDYRYNIRGWLTSINNAALTNDSGVTNDDVNDYFGLELLYNTASAGHEQYTGTIGEVKWKGVTDAATKSYRYNYDDLNQLTSAEYGIDGNYTQNALGVSGISYDRNGNITDLQRKGNVAGAVQTVDDLTFTYTANQLEAVDDATTYIEAFNDRAETTDEYDYDANGNMTKDLNKDMTSITYNHLNLATEVNFSDGRKVEYGYSAGGTLLWQKFYDNTTTLTKTRDFLGGQVFEDDILVSIQTEEGRITPVGSSVDYQYNLTDHQGNARVTFSTTPESYTVMETFETIYDIADFVPNATGIAVTGGQIDHDGTATGTRAATSTFTPGGGTGELYKVKFNIVSNSGTFWVYVGGTASQSKRIPITATSGIQMIEVEQEGSDKLVFSNSDGVTVNNSDIWAVNGIELFDAAIGNQGFQDLNRHTNTNANTTTGGDKVELLQTGQTGALGLFRMNKGDTINLSVQANYESTPSGNTFLGTVFSALHTSFDAGYGGSEGISSSSAEFGDALGGANMSGKGNTSTAPRAFVNYIFFDKDMNYVSAGFEQVSTNAHGVGVHETISINDIIADQEGYLLTYLSNENSEAVDMHFDDFTVYHGKTNIVQANDFYPFG